MEWWHIVLGAIAVGLGVVIYYGRKERKAASSTPTRKGGGGGKRGSGRGEGGEPRVR